MRDPIQDIIRHKINERERQQELQALERQDIYTYSYPRHRTYSIKAVIVTVIGLAFLGFIGFIVLSMRVGWIGAKRQFDLEFWTVTLSAFGWMGLCARYRRWFENFGRGRWPDGKYK